MQSSLIIVHIIVLTKQASFHLSPTLAIIELIDCSISVGPKHYEKSIKKLNKRLFNYETDNLHLFINILKEYTHKMG